MSERRHRVDVPAGSRGQAGFTMVEIVVATILLAIGVLTTARLVAGSETTSLDAELQQVATAEAENRVEEIISLPYAEIGHAAAPAEIPGESRTTATTFDAPGAGVEDLVIAANDEGGDSLNGLVGGAQVAQAEPIEIEAAPGAAKITGTAYTFVTWRDEECEVVDTSGLQSGVTELRDDLQALKVLLNDLNDEVVNVLGISNIPPSVRSIYNTLIPARIAELTAAIDELDSLIASLAGIEVDVCDLTQEAVDAIGGLVDPTDLGGFDASAEVLGVTAGVSAEAGFSVPLLASLVCNPLIPVPGYPAFCNDSNDLQTEINNGGLSATVTGVDADAANLAASLGNDTTHNTKRVTVGVVIDTPRSDITPQNVVWVSEVVSDPDEGLL